MLMTKNLSITSLFFKIVINTSHRLNNVNF